jgi:hypothetical protein
MIKEPMSTNQEKKSIEELRKEMRGYKLRTTVCTPTFLASKKAPGLSSVLGWMLFAKFSFIGILLFYGMVIAIKSPTIPRDFKIIFVGILAVLWLFLLVAWITVDILISQDEKTTKLVEHLEHIEEHAYNSYHLLGKTTKRLQG